MIKYEITIQQLSSATIKQFNNKKNEIRKTHIYLR